jgi:hypothetical protein
LAQQESLQPLRHVVRVGDELPLWGGASAKPALLARIARSSSHGSDHAQVLQSGLGEAADRAFAVSHGEREAGLSAVAVPLIGRSGAVVAALSLSGPTIRFPEDQISGFVADLRETRDPRARLGRDHPGPAQQGTDADVDPARPPLIVARHLSLCHRSSTQREHLTSSRPPFNLSN